MNSVNSLAETYQIPIVYSTHPRSRKFIEARGFEFHENVRNLEPFGFIEYNRLQCGAFCVVSDSGTLPEEASYFGFPGVCIRTSTERPEAIDKGNFVIGGITGEGVLQAVELAVTMKKNTELGSPVPDYIEENVSIKVVKIIQGYTGIVNKVVWGK